jgi:hypothetical protein
MKGGNINIPTKYIGGVINNFNELSWNLESHKNLYYAHSRKVDVVRGLYPQKKTLAS